MQKKHIEGSLHILVRALSENEKAKVVIGGRSTCTDGKTVWIGDLPPNNELAADLAFGKLYHECEHVDSTDFSAIGTDPVLWRKLGNALEDIRIERKRMSKYPGAKSALAKTVAAMVNQGGFQPISGDASPLAVLQGYVLYRLRNDCLEQHALQTLADGADAVFDATFSPQLKNRVDALMYEAETAASTTEIMAIAGAIMKAFQDAQEEQQPPEQSDSSQDPSSQGDTDAGDDGSGDNQQGGAEPGSAPDGDPGPDGGAPDAGSDDALKKNLQGLLSSNGDDGLEDFDQALNRLLNQVTQQASADGVLGDPVGESIVLSNIDGSLLTARVRRETSALRTRMAALVQARTLSDVSTARSGRRLDRNRVHRVATGNPMVFRRTSEGMAIDTAVYMLGDRSGSMKGEPLRLALDSMAAAALAMENINGIDSAIGVFPHYIKGKQGVGEVKAFGVPLRKQIGGLDLIQATGTTPLAEALLWAGLSLYRSPRPRKILMVNTDGDPDHLELTKGVIADVTKMGIEVVGVGIKTNAVKALFERFCVVNTLAELPKAIFGLLQETVLLEAA